MLLWESQSEQKWLNLSFKATPKFALTLAFLFMVVSAGVAAVFVFMGKLYMADMYAGRAVRAVTPSIEGSLTDLNRALTYYPKESRYFTRAGHESLALTLAEMNKGESLRNIDLARRLASDAIAATKRGVELMPKDVAAVESLGVVYENLSLLDPAYLTMAKEQYENASSIDTKNPLLLLKIAQIDKALADQKGTGDEAKALLTDAVNRLNQAIALKDDFAVAHHTLAIIQAINKDFDGAVASEEKAVARDSRNLTYIYSLALILQAREKDGDADQAEKIFKAILAANEKLVDVRVSLGILYEKQKKTQEAINAYEQALDAIPSDNERVANLRKQIEKMLSTVQSGGTNIGKPTLSAETPTPEASPVVPVVPAPPVNPSDTSIQESITQ